MIAVTKHVPCFLSNGHDYRTFILQGPQKKKKNNLADLILATLTSNCLV